MLFKKSQTATEYLIILSIVIVIALVVISVLGGIPSIGIGASKNTALLKYQSTVPVAITKWNVVNNYTVIEIIIICTLNIIYYSISFKIYSLVPF